MAAMVMGSAYSPPSFTGNHMHSPDHPKRLIKPLPSRSLRSRLSPEVADSILFPAAPKVPRPLIAKTSGKLYAGHLNNGSDISDIDKALIEAQRTHINDGVHSYQFKGNEMESEDEGFNHYPRLDRRREGHDSTPSRPYANGITRVEGSMERSTVSENDSVDGYDSFENTNNKKKRKIPTSVTSGSLGIHHSSLSTDLANMGLASGHALDVNGDNDRLDFAEGDDYASESTTPGTNGFSGSGRGLFGSANSRLSSRRSPLGVSANGSNTLNNRSTYRREFGPSLSSKDQGIISAAIASAASTPTPITKGQENISLVQRQLAAKKVAPVKTQFTFTCESDNSKDIVWPGDANTYPDLNPQAQPNPPPPISQQPQYHDTKPVNTTGTQTSPNMGVQGNQIPVAPQNASQQQQPAQPRKPRRSAAKRYAIAARDRRRQQQHNNYYHPPRDEDIWICEFCEYESIFGGPPEALVRQYEIKDRRERKRIAEKRRLLEKAKMKGRKGRKGTKGKGGGGLTNSTANNTPHSVSEAAQQQSQSLLSEDQFQNQGTQCEGEEFADEFDDESLDPVQPPLINMAPTKIPQPVGGGSGRREHGYSPGLLGANMGMDGSKVTV